jgi:signal transduction histidine kinase/ActR/RegA family two-component response regulator
VPPRQKRSRAAPRVARRSEQEHITVSSSSGQHGTALEQLQAAERRAAFLSEASLLLGRSLDYETTLAQVARLAVPVLAGTCVVHVFEGAEAPRVVIACTDRAREERLRQYERRWPVRTLSRTVVQSGKSLVCADVRPSLLESLAQDAAHLAELRSLGTRSFMVVPVVARERVLGTITLARYGAEPPYAEPDVALAEELGRRIGTAVDHARVFRQAHEAEARSLFLAEASHVLASSLDYPTTLRTVAELAVPRLADWCVIDVLGDDETIRRMAVVHRDPAHADMAVEMERRPPSSLSAPSQLSRVLRTGRSAFFPHVTLADVPNRAADDFRPRLLRAVNPISVMIVPLGARNRVLGAVTLMMAESGRHYSRADLALAEDLASRAALAVDNARLYREAQNAQRRSAFLAEAARLLASSLDYESTLATVARLVVTELADWCVVDAVGLDRRVVRLAVTHADPDRAADAAALQGLPVDAGFFSRTPEFIRRGHSLLATSLPPDALPVWAQSEEHLRVLRAIGPRSLVCVPIVVRDRVLGAINLMSNRDRRYGEPELALCEELARLAASAMEQGRLHRKVQAARAQADEANRLKDDFLATLSHELRSPLSAVLMWSHMMRRGRLDERQTARALETIEQNARMQVRLIEDLLDVSRIVADKLTLHMAPVELSAVIIASIEIVRAAAEEKNITLGLEVAGARVVRADPARLQQVFVNLLSNAIKFTGEGGRVAVEARPLADGRVMVTVADTGIGIPADVLPHVFDRFRQADSSTTRRYGGLGLGLAIARHLVVRHGGTIEAESAGTGQGAIFRVVLPLAPEERATPGSETITPLDSRVLEGARVVVVDDQSDARDLIALVLSRYGADVTPATSAAKALEALEGMRADALIADIAMPDEDGYQLARRIRRLAHERIRSTPIIAVSALASAEDHARALDAGFDAHLAKPVDPVELISVVARAIGR